MAVSDYSTSPGSNVDISGIFIGEGCAPGNINNAIRQLMADIKGYDGAAVPFTPPSGWTSTFVSAAIVEAYTKAVAAIPGAATTTTPGLMSAPDKVKLNGIATAATADAGDTQAVWNAGTSTTERLISPEKRKAAVKNDLNAAGGAPMFACRAWVNFNGGTGEIYASGNVASVVRNGTGNYRVTFATAMPDANYVMSGSGRFDNGGGTLAPVIGVLRNASAITASYIDVAVTNPQGSVAPADAAVIMLTFIR